MKHKAPHVVWVDIPAEDISRSQKFYSQLFDWHIEKDNKLPGSEYYMISNPPDGEQTHPHYFGGLLKRTAKQKDVTVFISVPSVDQYLPKIEKFGGKILEGKKAIPGWGYLAIFQDTEHNTLAIWEENKAAK